MTQLAKCPSCSTVNPFADEFVGRYAACPTCGCEFWVVVPPLDKDEHVSRPLSSQSVALSRPLQAGAATTGKLTWRRMLFWAYFAALNLWVAGQLIRWLISRQ